MLAVSTIKTITEREVLTSIMPRDIGIGDLFTIIETDRRLSLVIRPVKNKSKAPHFAIINAKTSETIHVMTSLHIVKMNLSRILNGHEFYHVKASL